MAHPSGDIRPYTPPLVRSIAAPVGRLIPARSGPKIAPAEHFATEDNVNDLANPYSGADESPARFPLPFPFFAAVGSEYGPPASFHNARATGSPMAPRTARGQAYVTPPALWNLSGIAPGFLQVLKAPRQTIKLAMGRWTPMQAGGTRPLPTLPEPARMIQPYT